MELHLDLEPDGALSRQIYEQLRTAIFRGRLRAGERLPPTRELARRLDLSRNTVSLAYDWLISEGLLSARGAAGTFVTTEASRDVPLPRRGAVIRYRHVWDRIKVPVMRPAPRFNFGAGMPDATLFPFDVWRRLLARQIRASRLGSDYGDPAGHPELRAAIAHHVALSRGVQATADDVIVTNGAQQAFDLIARVLVEPRMRVAVEDPGYPPPRLLLESMGASVAAVAVDESGLVVDALPAGTRLVYTTPSHQFPLGMPMSHTRRVALLRWAEKHDAVIIEDDYDSEFRFGGKPLETLQAIDRSGRVIYAGSFSKSMLPALRLGFLIAPPQLRPALRAASHASGWFVQWPAQAALASFIERGLLARHIRKMRRIYWARHERILQTVVTRFARWLEPVPSLTGMHLAAFLRSGGLRREADISRRAHAAGVGFDRLSAYCATDRKAGVILGYGGIATDDIDEGLERLRQAMTNG